MDNNLLERIFEMSDDLKDARAQKKALEGEIESISRDIGRMELILNNAMAEAGMDHFSRNGTTFSRTTRTFAFPREGQRETLMQALKDHGFSDLVIETVNAQSLASFCKKQKNASDEKQLPDWLEACVCTYEKPGIGVAKARGQK